MDSLDRLLKIFPTARTDQEYAQTFLWYHLRRYPDKKTANITEIQDYFRQADRPIPSIEFIRHAFLPHPTFRRGSANDTFGINEGPGTGIKWFDQKFGPCFIEEPGPPDDGLRSATQSVLPLSVVCNTRGYIERVANQVNGTYENGWYDACTVMVRRLLETLIIEAFEHHNLAASIKNTGGEFFSSKT